MNELPRAMWRLCVGAYVAALLLRAIAGTRAGSLYPDGVVELELASALAEGRLRDALDTRFHPLFALLVAPWVRAGLPAESVARALTVVVSSFAAPLCALAAGRLAPGAPLRAAAFAGLLAALQPWLVRLGGQVMAYGTAHAALALALWLALVAAARPGIATGLATGAAIGAGWLARSDGLATGAGLSLALLVGASRTAGARPAARAGLGLALGALLVMSPYLLAMRAHSGEWRLSLKKRAVDLVVAAPGPAPAAPVAREPTLGELVVLELEGEGEGELQDVLASQAATLPPLPAAAAFAARKALSAAHPLLLALAVAGLLVARRPGRWVAPAALGAFVLAHSLLKARLGYTSALHQSAAGVLVAPLAGVGAAALWRAARGHERVRGLLTVAAFAVLAPKALAPQLRGKAAERAIGPVLRRVTGDGPLLIAGHDARVVAHDARARYVDLRDVPGPPARAVAALRERGAAWLVVFLRRRDPPDDGSAPRLEAALTPLGVVPYARFSAEGDGTVRYHWLLFRIQGAS